MWARFWVEQSKYLTSSLNISFPPLLPLTPTCSSPSIVNAFPTSPTTATVTLNPPENTSVPVANYTLSVVPAGSSSELTVTCTDPTNCHLTGLTPSVTYTLTATATLTDGSTTPRSAPATLAMPPLTSPTLVSVVATGPTTATASASPPSTGGPWTSYTFTATVVGGSATVNVTCVSPIPTCTLSGLAPATHYAVVVAATDTSGNTSPDSNSLGFTTPSPRCVAAAVLGDMHQRGWRVAILLGFRV